MAATRSIRIAAFGALNQASYDAFEGYLTALAAKTGLSVSLTCAGPYPNSEAITKPGRPLRGDALKDPALMHELFAAVASDAQKHGKADIYCMPCMSMIGFHSGIEEQLGFPIIRLSDALKDFYKDVDRLGIIHMRPAKARVEEIFGAKAVVPDSNQSAALLQAEEKAKQGKSPEAVEKIMQEITISFRDQGLKHVLFARADAPHAEKGIAGHIEGIAIDSYFRILAKYIVENHAS